MKSNLTYYNHNHPTTARRRGHNRPVNVHYNVNTNTRTNRSGRSYQPLRKTALEERLEHIVLLELTADGGREYHTMTLRCLYDYVIKAITKNKDNKSSHHHHNHQNHQGWKKNNNGDQNHVNDIHIGTTTNTTSINQNEDGDNEDVENNGNNGNNGNDEEENKREMSSIMEQQQQQHRFGSGTGMTPPSMRPISPSIPQPLPTLPTPNNQIQPEEEEEQQQQESQKRPTSSLEEKDIPIDTSNTLPLPLPSSLPTPSRIIRHYSTQKNSKRNNKKNNNNSHLLSPLVPTTTTEHPSHQHHDHTITYRERLGGYLHPRDMRRLVTPFSSSNEPELIVRRHVMLLNFDPLRAIVLRDRMLLLVPDGADSILILLERSIRGGIDEMEKQVFGEEEEEEDVGDGDGKSGEDVVEEIADAVNGVSHAIDEIDSQIFGKDDNKKDKKVSFIQNDQNNGEYQQQIEESEFGTSTQPSTSHDNDDLDNEWDDIECMNWIEMPFELQSVDAVLSSVVKMLTDDASNLRFRILNVMEQLRGIDSSGGIIAAAPGDHTQEKLRLLKDEVKEMESRVQGFVRAMNQILDDEEDMALMNLSRIVTHPERFIQPVPQEILNEESDEPELILEAYLQQSLSEVNALELLKGQILNTEELVSLQMDTIRNRLLLVNTLISLVSLCVAMGSFIGSIFGMNLLNFLEDDEGAFGRVVIGTTAGMLGFLVISVALIYNTGLIPANPRKAWMS